MKLFFAAIFFLLLFSFPQKNLFAADLLLKWEMPNGLNPSDYTYTISWGFSSGNYPYSISGITDTQGIIPDIQPNKKYYFVLYASDKNNAEIVSEPSKEASIVLGAVIQTISAQDPTLTYLQWTSDTEVSSKIEIGRTAGAYDFELNTEIDKNHEITIAGLNPRLTYHYRISYFQPNGVLCLRTKDLVFQKNSAIIADLNPAFMTPYQGGFDDDGIFFILWTDNSSLTRKVNFPYSAEYLFYLAAKGTPAFGKFPDMDIAIDDQVKTVVPIDDYAEKTYKALIFVEKGPHTVSVVFPEDGYNPPNEDRNLLFRRGAIVAPTRIISPFDMNSTAGGYDWNPEYYNLWSKGRLFATKRFYENAVYDFNVLGLGTPALNEWPIMQLLINQRLENEITVNSPFDFIYSISAFINQGIQEFSFAFINDLQTSDEDRNLLFKKIAVTPWFYAIAANNMAGTAGGQDWNSNFYNLWSNGALWTNVNFPQSDIYLIGIQAKGQSAYGNWPDIKVLIDNQKIGQTTITSNEPRLYIFPSYIETGTHQLSILFDNDLYFNRDEDTNLLIKSLHIQ